MSGCPACVASRRSIVDAYFLGFRAGFVSGVEAVHAGAGEAGVFDPPRFCTTHEIRATQVHADIVRALLSNGEDT